MNRALISLIFTIGAAPVAAQEPSVKGTSRSVILPQGVTEGQMLRLLFPDYDERIRRSKAGEGRELNEDVFAVTVDAVVETDFGWGGEHFLVATASGSAGYCAQCQIGRAAVLDFNATKVLFQFPVDGEFNSVSGEPRFFRLAETDRTLSVAIEMFAASVGGFYFANEFWYYPRRRPDGVIQFDKVWEGRVRAGTAGNRGASAYRACGAMLRVDGSWYHVLSTYYGEALESEDDEGPSVTPPKDLFAEGWGVGCDDGNMGEVEIRRVQKSTVASDSSTLKGEAARTRRIDHDSSELFPFSLPVREGGWLRKDSTPLGTPTFDNYLVTSCSRHLVAEITPPSRFEHDNVVVRRAEGGEILRTIRLHHGDVFYGMVRSVGWALDESRVFIVITFGSNHTALLSFSVEGIDDYWEGLVDPDAGWTDGFVMDPVKVRKRPS